MNPFQSLRKTMHVLQVKDSLDEVNAYSDITSQLFEQQEDDSLRMQQQQAELADDVH